MHCSTAAASAWRSKISPASKVQPSDSTVLHQQQQQQHLASGAFYLQLVIHCSTLLYNASRCLSSLSVVHFSAMPVPAVSLFLSQHSLQAPIHLSLFWLIDQGATTLPLLTQDKQKEYFFSLAKAQVSIFGGQWSVQMKASTRAFLLIDALPLSMFSSLQCFLLSTITQLLRRERKRERKSLKLKNAWLNSWGTVRADNYSWLSFDETAIHWDDWAIHTCRLSR